MSGSAKKFISVWNEIKKIPSFMGKKVAVDQLNDTTAFPWFINFFKNLSTDYRKCKSNQWDYLISIHKFTCFFEINSINERNNLIKKYNERLLIQSKNEINPWVIDDRDETCITLNKKNYLEFDKKLNFIIDEEIAKKILTKKEAQLERKRLLHLGKLALLKTFKEESIEEFADLAINCQDWEGARKQFVYLITLELDYDAIQYEIKKQLKNNYKEFYVKFSRKEESVRIHLLASIWKKINKFVIKNKAEQFFLLFWSGITTHANLLNWISFLLIFFSLSLYSYPIIFLILGISLASYLIIHIFFLVKKNTIILPRVNTKEAEQILESIKLEVFNEEKNKHEFKLIHEIVDDLSKKNINLKEFLNSILIIQRNFDPIYLPAINLKESQLYNYLSNVYPKIQFTASLIVNLSSILFYTYLLTWAVESFLTVLGAVSLAATISSPVAVGILILIAASFFLLSHLNEFRIRENLYQRAIFNKINEKCKYSFKDEYGRQKFVLIEKWKKFEYLQNNIDYLELEFKNFFNNNYLYNVNNKFYSLFNSYMMKKNVYNSCDQEKVLGGSDSIFKILKKFLNRFFAFFGGGLYGYNLAQQFIWKSKLGLNILIKTFTLPIMLIFIPLIIINGIANLITYHFHSRQRNRLEIAKNLDSKLEILEQTNKNLLYLATLLSLELKYSASDVNLNVNLIEQSDLWLINQNRYFGNANHSFFFKENHQKRNISEKEKIEFESIFVNTKTQALYFKTADNSQLSF